ncbi:hypothetical protein K438DRAFT_1776516 [Mycena galopus ATCC 62051]|nr:hypothetical protein K438DRAFT_1776516 [Mycena galopus ATCC 62051]
MPTPLALSSAVLAIRFALREALVAPVAPAAHVTLTHINSRARLHRQDAMSAPTLRCSATVGVDDRDRGGCIKLERLRGVWMGSGRVGSVKDVINNEARYMFHYPYCGSLQPPPESGLTPSYNGCADDGTVNPPVNN